MEWLDGLPTWAQGAIFLGGLVAVLLIGTQFSGFWTAGTRGRPVTWDDVYRRRGEGGGDGGTFDCDGGDGGGD